MNKKILICLLLVLFLVCGCKKETINEDAKKFKEDYESLNGVTIKDDIKHRSITIEEDNPIVYKTFKDYISKMGSICYLSRIKLDKEKIFKSLQPLKADIKFIILIYQFSFFQRYRIKK